MKNITDELLERAYEHNAKNLSAEKVEQLFQIMFGEKEDDPRNEYRDEEIMALRREAEK